MDSVGGFDREGGVGGSEPELVAAGLAGRRLGRAQPVGAGQGLEEAHVEGGGANADYGIGMTNLWQMVWRCRGVHGGGGERQGNWGCFWSGGGEGRTATGVEGVGRQTEAGDGLR